MSKQAVGFIGSVRRVGHVLFGLAAAIGLSACGGGGSGASPAVSAPVITSQPGDGSALTGATVTFSVTATGTGLAYQWRRNGADVAGATNASYTTPVLSSVDSGAQYTVVVSNAGGSTTSSAARVNLLLSANQQAFESLSLPPAAGSYLLRWNLNFSGHNSFFSNPAILKPGSTWMAGAGYVKYTAREIGDRYNAVDCAAATTGAAITPCQTGTTLTAALTTGIASASDGVTYTLGDGALRTVGGVQIWVATAPRPVAAVLSVVPQYRIYFELAGNVYTGALVPDGSVFATSYYVSNPGGATVTDRLTFLPFQIRMNKAARDSVAAALAI